MNDDVKKFDETTVAITTKSGEIEAPALTHEMCPGLAVTMAPYGVFTVTHTATGMKLCGRFERCGTAISILVKFQMIAKAHDLNWSDWDDGSERRFSESFGGEVPFDGAETISMGETRKMTIREWMGSIRGDFFFNEFPWEDVNPLQEAKDNLRLLGS